MCVCVCVCVCMDVYVVKMCKSESIYNPFMIRSNSGLESCPVYLMGYSGAYGSIMIWIVYHQLPPLFLVAS